MGRIIVALLLIGASLAFLPEGIGLIIKGANPHADGAAANGFVYALIGLALLVAGIVYLMVINRSGDTDFEK